MDISGIFPPIPTPFNNEEEIDYVKLKDNVQKWNEIPFKGLEYKIEQYGFFFTDRIYTDNVEYNN